MVSCDSENVIKILSDSRHIRACIIISFSIQAFLTIFAPLRKCLGGKWGIFFSFLVWLAYLLADWIAIFTIGSISLISLIGSSSENDDNNVFWFWAPFLLLHLGGPETITAFALQDNEFWLRHLLGLIFQVGCTLYIFLMSLPHNKLWLPTLLALIAAIIKYAERICAFYHASFDHFGDNWVPGQSLDFYFPVKKEAASISESISLSAALASRIDQREGQTAGTNNKNGAARHSIPVQFKNLETPDCLHLLPEELTVAEFGLGDYNNIQQYFASSDSKSIVKAAVYLFGTIRRPLVGSFLSRAQLWKSFANLGSRKKDSSAREALQKIEIELSLLYEVLHTKWPVVVSKFGFLCRFLDIGCIVGAIVSFSLFKKQYKLEEFDTWLTYGLLIGAPALDIISLILLFVLSDWFFIAHFHKMGSKSVDNFINRRRWSKAVSQLNFIAYVVNDHSSWVKKCPRHSWGQKCLSLSDSSWGKKCPSLSDSSWGKKCLSLYDSSWLKKCLSWVKKWMRITKALSLSSQNFIEDEDWRFIFEQVERFSKISTGEMKQVESFSEISTREMKQVESFSEISTRDMKKKERLSKRIPISIRPNVDWFTMMVGILESSFSGRQTTLGDPADDRFVDPMEDPEQNIHGKIFLQDLFQDPMPSVTSGNLWNIMREYDFTRSLLILHIATELFLQDDLLPASSSSGSNEHRRTCKILSDYLFYLAIMESTMIAPLLNGWEKVFGDTYAEAKLVLKLHPSKENDFAKTLLSDLRLEHSITKDLGGSVLILAQTLARELRPMRSLENENDPYQMLSRVWVHLMAYAASNCGPNVHARQPSKGGELLTFVWLCIANCGDRELNHTMTRIKLD